MSLLWHPAARRVIIGSAPNNLTFTGGGRKMVWHTTEGDTIDGAVAAYRAKGVAPHFTIAVVDGRRTLYQHLPTNRAASVLRHPPGTRPTNTANAIQVEVVGFAAQSGNWPDSVYYYLHHLARWVHDHVGIPMDTDVMWRRPEKLTETEWVRTAGHVGHVHCPGNDHTDPGPKFHIGKVLEFPPPPPKRG